MKRLGNMPAPYTPDAVCPEICSSLSLENETHLVSMTSCIVTTRQRRFTCVRLSDPYLREVKSPTL